MRKVYVLEGKDGEDWVPVQVRFDMPAIQRELKEYNEFKREFRKIPASYYTRFRIIRYFPKSSQRAVSK